MFELLQSCADLLAEPVRTHDALLQLLVLLDPLSDQLRVDIDLLQVVSERLELLGDGHLSLRHRNIPLGVDKQFSLRIFSEGWRSQSDAGVGDDASQLHHRRQKLQRLSLAPGDLPHALEPLAKLLGGGADGLVEGAGVGDEAEG